jgi:hypothetical protein
VSIWDTLRRHASRQLVIDEEHPEEALPADVLPIEALSNGALDDIEHVLTRHHTQSLKAQQALAQKGILAKDWDKLFDQEKEWLAIRGLIAAALPRSGASSAKRSKERALLLIKA